MRTLYRGTSIIRLKIVITAALAVLLVAAIPAGADTFSFSGSATYSGQGFGTLYNLLDLHKNGTETGAVAPSNAANLTSLGTTFGACSGSPVAQCGNATNTSAVVTAANLASLGMTSSSTFGLLYNVNQQGNDLNTYLNSPTPFTVYFYDANGNVLFSSSYAGTTSPFPPAAQNGQGSAGRLFVLNGSEFGSNFGSIANIGMSATVVNANSGADGWSVVNATGPVTTPEPGSMFLLGSGLIGIAGYRRRRYARVQPSRN
jgi:hypothetical protein